MTPAEESVKFFYDNIGLARPTSGDNRILYFVETSNVPQCIKDVRKKIIAENGFEEMFHNHDHQDFAIYLTNGKDLPEHQDLIRDKEIDTYEHVRANWVVSTPESGGCIWGDDGKEYPPILDSICCINAKKPHGITAIVGNTPLIVISFGFIKRHSNYV